MSTRDRVGVGVVDLHIRVGLRHFGGHGAKESVAVEDVGLVAHRDAVLPSNRYIPHRVSVLIEHLARVLVSVD